MTTIIERITGKSIREADEAKAPDERIYISGDYLEADTNETHPHDITEFWHFEHMPLDSYNANHLLVTVQGQTLKLLPIDDPPHFQARAIVCRPEALTGDPR